ncbi:hypothetical protein E4T47_09052 [Aureobasidium subglaciale]|nr:hypothetical protein E4T47_09052 [Aureobasidium subglaciale]
MTLPESRAFINSLITSLQTKPPSPTTSPTNTLKQATPADRSILLTLHVLYPNELLSALDLLDRELVDSPPAPETVVKEANVEQGTIDASAEIVENIKGASKGYNNAVYYVRSAQQTSSNSRFRDPVASSTHYEVRTSSWSCSCPAFAFSAFPANLPEDEGGEDIEPVAEGEEQEWMVGGLSLGKDVPMCKHLLACVLAKRGGMFGAYVKTREVSVEELAGWAAGWGG